MDRWVGGQVGFVWWSLIRRRDQCGFSILEVTLYSKLGCCGYSITYLLTRSLTTEISWGLDWERERDSSLFEWYI